MDIKTSMKEYLELSKVTGSTMTANHNFLYTKCCYSRMPPFVTDKEASVSHCKIYLMEEFVSIFFSKLKNSFQLIYVMIKALQNIFKTFFRT